MSDYVLSCCSTADVTEDFLKERDIHYLSFRFSVDGKIYTDNYGKSLSYADFYAAQRKGAITKTAQLNISEYLDYFTPFLESGKDILHCCLSSGLSGTFNSAENAAAIARERYPERRIRIVDSLSASSGTGILMAALARMRDQGVDLDHAADFAEQNRLRIHHWFFSSDLTTYVRGGRISKAAGIFGGLLNICPLMNMDMYGRLIPRYKIRGRKKCAQAAVDRMVALADNGSEYDGDCFISHSNCLEDAEYVRDLVEERFPHLKGKIPIFYIGTTIGSHSGEGTVALFFWGQERKN